MESDYQWAYVSHENSGLRNVQFDKTKSSKSENTKATKNAYIPDNVS